MMFHYQILCRKRLAILGFALTIAAIAVWLEPTRVVWGWLRGEAFYDGRSTSWWERELLRWDFVDVWSPNSEKDGVDFRSMFFFERRKEDTFAWLQCCLRNERTRNLRDFDV